MLGKLLKHEWLSTWKVPTALFIYLCIITLLGCTSFLSPLWQSESNLVEILAVFSLMFYILSLFGISIAIFVYFVVRFYRNMYTGEGYLMHTLPVKPWQHIFAKGIVYCCWTIINLIAVALSIVSLLASALYSVLNASLHEFVTTLQRELPMLLPELAEGFQRQMGMSIPLYILFVILVMLVQLVYTVLMIYASISIGQTFNKHKVAASFIAYAAINTMMQLLNSLIQMPMMIFRIEGFSANASYNYTFGDIFTPTLWISLGINLVFIVVFYFVTEYIMRRKLNLD